MKQTDALDGAVTIRCAETPEEQDQLATDFMALCGFRIEMVEDEEFLIPIDPEHPDYAKCVRKLGRAKKKAAQP